MVMAVEMMMTGQCQWGTWEELLLGGAVLRHGTGDWNVVAGELRSRSLFPETFTPETCKAKYEDLRQRYSGHKAWFEELKKKRMAELRVALEKSEGSIGSLESKLQSLKGERKDGYQNDYDSSRTLSPEPCQKSDGAECTSKDLSSAGSFTQPPPTGWSPETKSEVPAMEQGKNLYNDNDKVAETVYGGQILPSMKKRRGKRKRKDCSKDVKEASAIESDLLDSSAEMASVSRCKEASTSISGQIARSDVTGNQSRGHDVLVPDEMMRIYNTVAQNECASVFRRRLDSQKRGRYKKLVLRHLDLDTIQSRIRSGSISSAKELYRDLLLVANNASIFYSKNTREYKSAMRLRYIVTKSLKEYLMEDHHATQPKIPTVSSPSPPQKTSAKKPRSIRSPKKPLLKTKKSTSEDVMKTTNGGRKTSGAGSTPTAKSSPAAKKGSNATRRIGGRCTNQRTESTASMCRKRTRVR